MKFLHTADLHLNAQRLQFPQTYLKRAQWVLDALASAAAEYECDCIVVAGDVFDRPDLTNAERYLFSEWLGRIQIPALVIAGNHDTRSRAIGDTCLRDLSALRLKSHLVYDGDPCLVHAHGCVWVLLPYMGWPQFAFDLVLISLVEKAQAEYPDVPIVVVMHEAVRGSRADNDHEIKSAVLSLLSDVPVTYWALGDIHLMQRVLPNAFYPGSPYQVNFGERMEKSVLLVDTDDPTDPEVLDLACPYPLVASSRARRVWPEFSSYTGEEDIELPSHVLRSRPKQDEVAIDVKVLESHVPPLWRLEELLVQHGLEDKLIKHTVEMAEKMLEDHMLKGM